MIRSSKILWGEGLFLRPQHFQRQDAYHEWRLAEQARALHPYAWGVRRLVVDTDSLANGVLRLIELQAIFPDSEQFSAPLEDELPPPVSLANLDPGISSVTFYATLPAFRSAGSNFATPEEAANSAARYVQHNQEAQDWFTQADTSDVVQLQRTMRLVPETEPRDHLVSFPLCRILRSTTGAYTLDPDFMPPAVNIGASMPLLVMLRQLLDALQAKVDALYGFHREPSKHVIEFRSGDIASFWLLHTASSAYAALSHYHNHPQLHPERLFKRMLELAGALMTFSKTYSLGELPSYNHTDPGACFTRLDEMLRELLETVISTRYFAIALAETKPSFYTGRLDSGQITPATNFYLGVRAAMSPAELVSVVPPRFKIGAPDDVDKLVLSATSGVRLTHAPQVPGAIPVKPDFYYFLIEPRGPLYERMLKGQVMTIYAPSGIHDLQMELYALNP